MSTKSVIEPLDAGIIFLAPIFEDCVEIDLKVTKVKGCIAVTMDSAKNFIITAKVNGYTVFQSKFKGNFKKQFPLDKVPVISQFCDLGEIAVAKFSYSGGQFSCTVTLKVHCTVPFFEGWYTIKTWKIKKKVKFVTDAKLGDVVYFLDDDLIFQ